MTEKTNHSSLKLIEDNYKLSLKLFTNKNFENSYSLIKDLYSKSFDELNGGLINEKLFVKIVDLYLVQLGFGLKNSDMLPDNEKRIIHQTLSEDLIMNDLITIYKSRTKVPYEILYHLCLVYVLYASLFGKEDWLLFKFEEIYASIPSDERGRYLKKITEQYVFEVLPISDKFDLARNIIEQSTNFSGEIGESIEKLNRIKENKETEARMAKEKEKERLAMEKANKERELEKSKAMEKQNNLKYKSLKEIQNQYASEVAPEKSITSDSNQLKSKVIYLAKLTKHYLKENSFVILIVLLCLFGATKFARLNNIDVKSRLKETILMAFKISYL